MKGDVEERGGAEVDWELLPELLSLLALAGNFPNTLVGVAARACTVHGTSLTEFEMLGGKEVLEPREPLFRGGLTVFAPAENILPFRVVAAEVVDSAPEALLLTIVFDSIGFAHASDTPKAVLQQKEIQSEASKPDKHSITNIDQVQWLIDTSNEINAYQAESKSNHATNLLVFSSLMAVEAPVF